MENKKRIHGNHYTGLRNSAKWCGVESLEWNKGSVRILMTHASDVEKEPEYLIVN